MECLLVVGVGKTVRVFFEQNNYCCYTPTLRSHHFLFNSTPPSHLGTISVLDYVNDLENKIQQLDSLPILIGHSMGRLIAQILGSRGLAKALITPAAPHGIMNMRLSVIKNIGSTGFGVVLGNRVLRFACYVMFVLTKHIFVIGATQFPKEPKYFKLNKPMGILEKTFLRNFS